jgi:hypothetical protein
VKQIVPQSVTLGGAHPVFAFTRHINRDQFLDETFVFRGTDVKLPPGIIEATVTGTLKNGQTFATSTQVFNRNLSFYSKAQVQSAVHKEVARPDRLEFPAATLAHDLARVRGARVVPVPIVGTAAAPMPLKMARAPQDLAGPVVKIHRRHPVVAGQRHGPKVAPHLQASMNHFLRHADASPAAAAGGGGSAT